MHSQFDGDLLVRPVRIPERDGSLSPFIRYRGRRFSWWQRFGFNASRKSRDWTGVGRDLRRIVFGTDGGLGLENGRVRASGAD
jgi:hypothetical protein